MESQRPLISNCSGKYTTKDVKDHSYSCIPLSSLQGNNKQGRDILSSLSYQEKEAVKQVILVKEGEHYFRLGTGNYV